MYGCESWPIKKAEHWRIDAFELWCRRRLLRVPWTARRSKQSILREISPEYSLEGLMVKLKLQYSGHLMRRTNSLGKTLMLGDWRKEKGTTEDEVTDISPSNLDSSLCFIQLGISHDVQFLSAQSLSHVWLFVTSWTAACQASLSTACCTLHLS